MSAPLSRLAVLLVVAIAPASCGRVGYDLMDVHGRNPHGGRGTGAASSGPDSGAVANGGNGGSSSGGRGGTGATDSGLSENGGRGFSDASSGGAAASDAIAPDGGFAGSGGSGGTSSVPPDAGGRAGAVGSGGSAGSGDAGIVGCADGQREGFLDMATYPAIAACAGGFALPGVTGLSTPACGRTAGDDGASADGAGCNALDLCAVGFHICSSSAEVSRNSSTGCAGAAVGTEPVFFITAQSGDGARDCAPTGSDDVFGCGTLGARPVSNSNCTPLDRWSTNLCAALTAPWACGSDQTTEAAHVEKPGANGGGVLCCRD